MTIDTQSTMTPLRYFSRRAYMGPPPSNLPALVLGVLALLGIVGLFVDIASL